MAERPGQDKDEKPEAFAELAGTAQPGLLREMLAFMWREKKWFLTPIIILLLLTGIFVFAAGSGAGAFIYTLF